MIKSSVNSPRRSFSEVYLIGKYNVSTLVVGYDHRLGHGKDERDIEEIAASCGIRTVRVGKFQVRREGDQFHCYSQLFG